MLYKTPKAQKSCVGDKIRFAFPSGGRASSFPVMEFTNLTRRVEIGANSYALKLGDRTLILDTGLHPKGEGLSATPDFDLVPPGTVDSIVVTHAHHDHLGSLPVLTRRETTAHVLMSGPTSRIAEVMLHNSVNVMIRQREDDGITEYPLYTHRGVDLCMRQWHRLDYRRPFTLSGERAADDEETTVELYPAGHIMGSAGVMVRHRGRTLFYTGDVNFEDQTLMRAAEFPDSGVDTLVIECTRGDAPTPPGFTRKAEEARLARCIREAFDRGGSITIPVFALGKTQELMAMLWKMRTAGSLANIPIYIGGLSTKITVVYDALCAHDERSHPEFQILQEMAPYVLSGNDIQTIAPRKNCIFALSSGMMTEHTLSNIFARRVLSDPNQSLFFVGYSDPESPAGRIRLSEPGSAITLDPDYPPVPMRCHFEQFNFSAHSSRETLLAYSVRLKPRKILLVHGDLPAIEWFRKELARQLPGTEVVVPEPGKTLEV